MIYIALFVVFVFAIAAVQVKSNNKRKIKVERFAAEAPSRIRIFNDSMNLLEKTNNAQTFIGRVVDVEEFMSWAIEQVKNGMPLQMEGNILTVRNKTNELINRNALRVALAEFAKWNEVPRKTGTRFDTATIKMFDAVDGLTGCLKEADNKSEVQTEILRIRDLVEGIYADVK